MLNQAFSVRTLRRTIKFREPYLYGLRGRKAVRAKLESLVADIHGGTFAFKGRSVHPTRKGMVFSTKDFSSVLVQRKLNLHLKTLYKVKQSNRQLLISQIVALLRESVPKNIIKLDIKKFYESIDRNITLTKIKKDPLLSLESKKLLEALYADAAFQTISGFPRGLCTSATLSELHLRDFDRAVVSMDGVYFYTRYVDDIIIFSFKDPERILSKISDVLATKFRLRLNESKTQVITIGKCVCKPNCNCGEGTACECKNTCTCKKKFKEYRQSCLYPTQNSPDNRRSRPNDKRSFHALDYLGYRFYFPPIVTDDMANDVIVNVSPKKVRKIKTRMASSIKLFEENADFDALLSRIKFLSSNFKVNHRSKTLSAGIFFNYPMVDRAPRAARMLRQFDALGELDAFLTNILFVNSCKIGIKARALLSTPQKKALAGMSFSHGFDKKFMIRVSRKNMEKISEAWVYEKN